MAVDTEAVKTALEEIRPALQRDGGDIELVEVEDDIVKVRLQGTCAGCPFSRMTLKNGVEARLKQQFPDLKGVEEVTG